MAIGVISALTEPLRLLVKTGSFVVLLINGSMIQAGGWATAVLDELPEFAVRGEPVNVTFTLRQHGIAPLKNLKIHIVAKNKTRGEILNLTVNELADGIYTSDLDFPSLGTWDWEIKTDWPGPSEMPPIEVVEFASESMHQTSSYQRGARLFITKGCITCHKNARVQSGNVRSLQIGIDLTSYKASAKFLHLWLTDPKAVKPESTMPDQDLNRDEIIALTSLFTEEKF
ncbi:MAG: hypothetical protein ABGY96_25480 [bacterium]|nr:hypothetical protein [Gammaproteobacteria bacterium]HIL98525.1 hypothetical protein [Pseudomonadales bacterium]